MTTGPSITISSVTIPAGTTVGILGSVSVTPGASTFLEMEIPDDCFHVNSSAGTGARYNIAANDRMPAPAEVYVLNASGVSVTFPVRVIQTA